MRRSVLGIVFVLATTCAVTAQETSPPKATTGSRQLSEADQHSIPAPLQSLWPLHQPLGPAGPGDWLSHQEETGQTYRQFLADGPTRATAQRRTIHIQPVGEFTDSQRQILEKTADFMRRFFQLPVKIDEAWPLSTIPAEARRDSPLTNTPQILSTWVLDALKPRVPADASAVLVLTATDLWAGEGWNFVYGQASLQYRVGVWSMHRFGDPSKDEDAFRQVLRRTVKVASHETAHMFSLDHCVYYECVMNGSNNLREIDHHPLWLCPQCLAKLNHSTGGDPRVRFQQLIEFAKREGFIPEQSMWEHSLEALGPAPAPPPSTTVAPVGSPARSPLRRRR